VCGREADTAWDAELRRIGMEDKEIWSVVAILRKRLTVSEADYKTWTAAP
jgi:hypothetical protein